MRATQRLIARGFEAYLVGGCVRDLLLGRPAKDYDIATGARPQQVKRTFPRNCRIIGRRFKLAHLHFHGNTKILEVSTFRRTPQTEGNDDDLLITRDNEFGTAEEDALRRDFTVNALFLDPTSDRILDWTNGLDDLHARVIRTIGDPRVRFREDPVRILRAAKFAGRLGFTIEPETFAAMAETAGDLVRSAPPRLLEEVLRLLRGGHALESFQLLRDVGALRSILPVLADFLQTARHDQRVAFWRLLETLDHRVQGGHVPQNAVLLGVLLVCPVLARAEAAPDRSPSSVAEELLGPLSYALRLPRRDAGCLKRICGVQHRFAQPGKRFRVAGFVQGPYFDEALELFELRLQALGGDPAMVDEWYRLSERDGHHPDPHDQVVDGDEERESVLDDDATTAAGPEPTDVDDDTAPAWPQGRVQASASDGAAEDVRHGEGEAEGEGERRGRRRRRRRRGRRPTDPSSSVHPSARMENAALDDGDATGAEDESGAPEPQVMPQRAADDPFADAAGPHDAGDGGSPFDATAVEPAPGEPGDAEPGRRRRRRRRGRRGRRHHDERFPASDQPAPHGEAVDAEGMPHQPLAAADVVADPDAAGFGPEGESEGEGGEASADAAPAAGAAAAEATAGSRRRRRRGRRGRSRGGDHAGNGGPPPGDALPRPPGGSRHENRRDRDPRRRGGGPRDVDVVPRYRDRRGKIDVIEPAPLDLSAFDVELDPKRVPTFGSIVEGQGRPKRRSPRVPQDGVDDYRPPPPPGGDSGPSAPPPPPPRDDDTFGDW
ncbi:MAG: polynucleotide adenylyltransferase PcnB [Planctomycetes bacterium]|nr:polynucleotide adenylyltransferase PcnB [Planctomycetota bacterium]